MGEDQDTHTPEEALEQVWGALRDHYPLMEYLGAFRDPSRDVWLEEFRPRVRQARSLTEAFPIIEELVLRFQDCHTTLQWPGKPRRTRPPIRLGWVEGGVAVLRATDETGLYPGDRVTAIDGRDPVDAIRDAWPHVSGAHPEGHVQGALDHLIGGSPGSELTIGTLRGAVHLLRPQSPTEQPPQEPVSLRTLDDGETVVLRIRTWGGDELVQRLDGLLEQARYAPYLVLDVRGNRGGYDEAARALVGRFIRRPLVCSIGLCRITATNRYESSVAICHPRGPWTYGGRTAVLADVDCHSACVHFVAAMAASRIACIVGQPTDGAGGWMQRVELPCGAVLVCSRMFPIDGGTGGWPSMLHGTRPHIPALPTLTDLAAGRDTALQTAVAWLRSGQDIPVTGHEVTEVVLS